MKNGIRILYSFIRRIAMTLLFHPPELKIKDD